MGHIAHLRKQFKSINTYGYIITLIEKKKTLLILCEFIGFHLKKLESFFRNYLPLEKVSALHLNKFKSLSPNDALCQVWLKLAQWFWRRRFLNFVNVISRIPYYLPLEKGSTFIRSKTIKPLHSRMPCAKFG